MLGEDDAAAYLKVALIILGAVAWCAFVWRFVIPNFPL
jgi:hypothetical protein